MKTNILEDKSSAFAIRMVKLYQFLQKESKEFILSKQVLRWGTSVGASVRESTNASIRKDFIYKLTIALKEADETCYWLELLYQTNYIEEKLYLLLADDCNEKVRLLTSSLKTAKQAVT